MSNSKNSIHEPVNGKSDLRMKPKTSDSNHHLGFVAGGYANLVNGVESEVREIIEEKYADEWNASGLLHRWRLQRKMDREIAEIVAEKMPNVSSDALF